MSVIEIKVPDIGDFDEVTVIELLVKPGDTVRAEQSLVTVESDKASMEIPSSHAGVVQELKVALGSKVKQGALLLLLEATRVATEAPAANVSAAIFEHNQAAAPVAAAPVATFSVALNTGPVDVCVPDIGDFKDVTVIEVMVKEGDSIKLEQSLVTVESDKASMEIPSSAAGVIKQLKVKLGDKVNIGDLLVVLAGSVPVPGTHTLEQKQLLAPVNQAQVAPGDTGPSARRCAGGSAPCLTVGAQICPPARCAAGRSPGLGTEGAHHRR